MNVLSLFDGISCGQLALERAGESVENYYASEIDKYAMIISNKNYPDIKQLGNVVDLDTEELKKLDIDLLIGGSPCQGFSMAGKMQGSSTICGIEVVSLEQYLELKLEGFEFQGESYLFWEYIRILRAIKPKNFLLENVMITKKWLPMFNETLSYEPIIINSALVSAQNRKRMYWTNIPGVEQPENQGITLSDVLQTKGEYIKISKKGVYKKFQDKMSCLTAGGNSGGNYSNMDLIGQKLFHIGNATDIRGNESIKRIYAEYGKMPTLSTCQGGHRQPKVALNDYEYRRLTPIEFERGQTVPDNYTKGVSNSQRYKMLGNGWTIAVIAHILKNIDTK